MTITNNTIKKLTSKELNDLGVSSIGVYTYKGIVKQRIRGFKTVLRTDSETHFEGDKVRWEVIKTADTYENINGYAVRCFNKKTSEYETFYQILIGCDFFK